SLIRLFRLTNVNSTDLVGHVFCYVDDTTTGGVPDTASNIRAILQLGNNQTLMSIFTIPAGTSGYMRDWYAAISGAKKTSVHTVRVEARPFGQVFQLKHQSSILAAGSSSIQHFYTEPEIFLEKTDIEIRVNSDEDQASVSAGFDIVLVEN
ncbi:MAG: hypothetical protein KAS32_09885, partial [Candidatus Peribacteraceae bacterium]|nr:hypothetical protein [Candidatus Peribacteraceae bacterium]